MAILMRYTSEANKIQTNICNGDATNSYKMSPMKLTKFKHTYSTQYFPAKTSLNQIVIHTSVSAVTKTIVLYLSPRPVNPIPPSTRRKPNRNQI